MVHIYMYKSNESTFSNKIWFAVNAVSTLLSNRQTNKIGMDDSVQSAKRNANKIIRAVHLKYAFLISMCVYVCNLMTIYLFD